MKTATQVKALIRNMAHDRGIDPQILLRNYMMERFLERIAVSSYRENFILKGGILVASMIGSQSRSTLDIDATIDGIPLTAQQLETMVDEIIHIDVEDGISFVVKTIVEIRENDSYKGYRISMDCVLGEMCVPLKIDLTSGDSITPRKISYVYPLMLEERSIEILAYNLETLLAEKLESILYLNITGTRMRDYYDVYVLHKTQRDRIDVALLHQAIQNTMKHRETIWLLDRKQEIMEEIRKSAELFALWRRYQSEYEYASNISFENTIETLETLLDF